MSAFATATASSYEEHRVYVLAVLRRRCGWLDEHEREAALHDAYLILLQKERDGTLDVEAMDERQVRAYLVQTAIHKALDEGKRAGRARTTSLEDHGDAWVDDSARPDELAVASQTNALMREIVAELPERRRAIVKLRFYFDRTPEEIQDYLGISERAYRRELERAMRHIAGRYELVRDDLFCDSRRSVILAFVAGVAGPNRAQEARDHMAICPGCAHWAAGLRETARGAAALLPFPAVAPTGWLDRLTRSFGELRDLIGGHFTSAKHHATEIVTRVDSGAAGYATAARPGTLAAAVSGCIAIGSGATYCVAEGVPGALRPPLLTRIAEAEPKKEPQPQRKRPAVSAAASTPDPPAVPATTTPAPTVQRPAASQPRQPTRRSPRRAATRPSAQAAAQEFGIEGSGEPAGAVAQPESPVSAASAGGTYSGAGQAPAPSPPAPAPGPPGEFDP